MKHCMKILSLLLAVLLLTACGTKPVPTGAPSHAPAETAAPTEPQPTEKVWSPVGSSLRHMSFNILGLGDRPGFDNEAKKANLKAVIEQIDPDTFGVQEASQEWTDGFVELLDGKYAVVGGHSDPKVERPVNWTNAIYYKVDTFLCLDSGMIFLNGDRSYVSGKPTNNCSFALLERKEDGALLLVLNHHLNWLTLGTNDVAQQNFEFYGIESREVNIVRENQVVWSSEWGNELAQRFSIQYGKPVAVILSGDFNVNALDTIYGEYGRMNEALELRGYRDTAHTAVELITNQTAANWVTYRKSTSRLDYIYGSESILPQTFTVFLLTQEVDDSSDHLPVILDYYLGE